MADGGQIRSARISPGTSYSDGVFEDRETRGKFLGSRISWNGWYSNWTVVLKDGTEYTVQGCNANSNAGQCAVTEMRNKAGERLTINRDGDGNIGSDLPHCLRWLESPCHFVSQGTLAEMIGTTRSRVSFFVNKFRKLGFIKYNGGLEVNDSLLRVILHD